MAKSQYGLTDKGLVLPSYVTVKSDIESSISAQIGAVDFEVPSIIGVVTSIVAEREIIIWEQVQNIFNAFFVDTATGISLDYVVASNLLTRLQPTYTKAICQLSGTNSTNIPKGSQILLSNSDTLFTLAQSTTINNDNCFSIVLSISDLTQVNYVITINNTPISYVKEEGDTAIIILAALETLINDGAYNVVADLVGDTLTITTVTAETSFKCYLSVGINIIWVTTNALFICNDSGSISAPSHSLVSIQTPIQGWITVDNITAGITGRDLETDVELRKRQQNSLNIEGCATDLAIQSRLLQVAGVTAVSVISDRTNHTISTTVLGGEDIDVATMLQLVRPAGIRLIGNTEVQVTDSTGTYTINFTRPQNVYIFVNIELTVNDAFVPESTVTIQNKIINYVNALGVNTTVVYQALYAAIYSVGGVTSANVLIGGSTDQTTPPVLASANIAISANQMPFTNSTFITITN